MKKILLSLLVVLLSVGVAYAGNIPWVVDPKNQVEVWTTSVYNNAGKELTRGEVVIWDIGSSDGDNDNYVTVTSTADTLLVAGIVYPSAIADGANGTIAIYGMVDVDYTGAQTVLDVVCTSGTTDKADDCTNDYFGFGVVMEATDPGKAFINPRN